MAIEQLAEQAYIHALYLQRAAVRLGAVRKGKGRNHSYWTFSKLALEHDLAQKSEHWGAENKNVTYIEEHLADGSEFRTSILTPETITLQNAIKSEKEISVIFHEPLSEEMSAALKRKNYTEAAKRAGKRMLTVRDAFKKEMLAKINFQIREMVSNRNPSDATIRLIFSGEGLAGCDAQLALFSWLEDMASDIDKDTKQKKYAHLQNVNLNIQLSTIDSVNPAGLSQTVKPMLEKIKKHYPKIAIKSYSLDTGQLKGRLGDEHIFYDIEDKEQVDIQYEKRDNIDGALLHREDNGDSKKLAALKNNGALNVIYQSAPFRFLYNQVSAARNFMYSTFNANLKNIDILDKKNKTLNMKSDASEVDLHPCTEKDPVRNPVKKTETLSPYNLDHHAFSLLVHELDISNRLQLFKPLAPIENLVLEGGGVKGLAYAGALKKMQEAGKYNDVKRIAGSSAGAIVAALLAAGYSADQIEEKMKEIDFSALMDRKNDSFWNPPGVRHIKDAMNLASKQGVYQGKAFLNLIEDLMTTQLHAKLLQMLATEQRIQDYLMSIGVYDLNEITFMQLTKIREDFPALGLKELYITGTKLSTGELVVFSHKTHPNMPVVDAVRVSMGFPGAFEPYIINGEEIVDGGLGNNWPMNIFDDKSYLPPGVDFTAAGTNPCTLGFLVDSQAEIKQRWCGFEERALERPSFFGFAGKIFNAMQLRSEDLQKKYQMQAVQIYDEDIPTLDFKLSAEAQKKLLTSGYREMDHYLQYYRGSNVYYEGLYFKDFAHKYAPDNLTFEQITQILKAELEPYSQKLSEFKEKYINYSKDHERMLIALENARDDLLSQGQTDLGYLEQQIDRVKFEIETCEAAVMIIIDKEKIVESERKMAEEALNYAAAHTASKAHGFKPMVNEGLAFQKPGAKSSSVFKSKASLPDKLGILIPHKIREEKNWQAVHAFLETKKDRVTDLQALEDGFKFNFKYDENEEPLASTLQKHEEQLSYYLSEVPTQEASMRRAFVELFRLSIDEMLINNQNVTVDLNIAGSIEQRLMMQELLNAVLKEKAQALHDKGIQINIPPLALKTGLDTPTR